MKLVLPIQILDHVVCRARIVRRPKPSARLTPAASRRQGETTRLAILILGREAAIEFMNSHDVSLGGRPIDLAIASDEGRSRVELALSVRCYPTGERELSHDLSS